MASHTSRFWSGCDAASGVVMAHAVPLGRWLSGGGGPNCAGIVAVDHLRAEPPRLAHVDLEPGPLPLVAYGILPRRQGICAIDQPAGGTTIDSEGNVHAREELEVRQPRGQRAQAENVNEVGLAHL